MKEILLSTSDAHYLNKNEYLNYLSLILREVKSCKLLSAGAKHCWELLYDLSKFDSKRLINISIKKIKSILSDSKSYRTIQRYLTQLAMHDFITIKKNFDSYGRIENTYSIKVPTFITSKLNLSTTKVFIKSINPVSKPVNSGYDSFVQGNKELNIINNNCYSFENEEILPANNNSIKSDCTLEFEPDSEILEYYPAKEKPSILSKAVLRHALKQAVKFEALITAKLTKAQEKVIKQIIAFWTAWRYVSSPKDCFDWIQSVLLNPKALSQCKNNFLQKINVIFKLIREKRFSKPFKQRYEQKQDIHKSHYQPRIEDTSSQEVISRLFEKSKSLKISGRTRKTYQEQENIEKLQAYEKQIASVEQKLKVTDDMIVRESLRDLIKLLHIQIQEVGHA